MAGTKKVIEFKNKKLRWPANYRQYTTKVRVGLVAYATSPTLF